MLNYDREAATYDETRGGEPRALAAAGAILELLPAHAHTLLDVACGTGIVTAHLTRGGLATFGADASVGMASRAGGRIGPGRVVLADCCALPYRTASLDAVTAIWLLHLIDDVAGMVAEAARVLRPGGALIVTVDKNAARAASGTASDAFDTVCRTAGGQGLTLAGETSFIGYGQGSVRQTDPVYRLISLRSEDDRDFASPDGAI